MATRSALQLDWTVERLHALPNDGKRYEIIDGILYVTPAPRYVHQRAVMVLYALLQPYATMVELDVMPLLGDVRYSERTLVQPDIFVFRNAPGARVRDWPGIHPLHLVVEVLSRSTRTRDRTVKRALYQAEGIPEYWIVDIRNRAFEWWRPAQSHSDVRTRQLLWQPVPERAPLVIDVPAYFRDVLDE